jgi:hypothetical protein
MKTFNQLNKEQQDSAVEYEVRELLTAILDHGIRFNDALNGDDLQARIDAAIERAEQNQTPWFAHEYVMDTCGDDLRGMARCTAEDAVYSEPNEYVVSLTKLNGAKR